MSSSSSSSRKKRLRAKFKQGARTIIEYNRKAKRNGTKKFETRIYDPLDKATFKDNKRVQHTSPVTKLVILDEFTDLEHVKLYGQSDWTSSKWTTDAWNQVKGDIFDEIKKGKRRNEEGNFPETDENEEPIDHLICSDSITLTHVFGNRLADWPTQHWEKVKPQFVKSMTESELDGVAEERNVVAAAYDSNNRVVAFILGMHKKGDVFIDVLCAHQTSGKILLKEFVDKLDEPSVRVDAVTTVLTYYPKFGFKFRNSCEDPAVDVDLDTLKGNRRYWRSLSSKTVNGETRKSLQKLVEAKLFKQQHNYWHRCSRIKTIDDGWGCMDDGIKMALCRSERRTPPSPKGETRKKARND